MQPTNISSALKKIIRSQPQTAAWAAKVFQTTSKSERLKDARRKELIKQESEIGATLFGPIPPGHTREFFCLDERTWIYQETWNETLDGDRRSQMIRYEIRDSGIIKSIDGAEYHNVGQEEAENLAKAAILYYQYISQRVYGKEPKNIQEELPHLKLS